MGADLARVLADHQHWAKGPGAGEHAAVAVLLYAVVHGHLQDAAPVFEAAVDQDGNLDWEALARESEWPFSRALLVNAAASLFQGGVDKSLTVNLGDLAFVEEADYTVFTAMLQAARTKTIPAGYR
jgi:hypothetical protein